MYNNYDLNTGMGLLKHKSASSTGTLKIHPGKKIRLENQAVENKLFVQQNGDNSVQHNGNNSEDDEVLLLEDTEELSSVIKQYNSTFVDGHANHMQNAIVIDISSIHGKYFAYLNVFSHRISQFNLGDIYYYKD